jgi:hypothetical protein
MAPGRSRPNLAVENSAPNESNPHGEPAPRGAIARAARELAAQTTWADRALILLLLAGAAAGIVFARPRAPGAQAVVTVAGTERARLDLAVARSYRAAGPLGETEIVVEEGAARIAASPCRGKICIRMGRARRAGQLLVCVPNRVTVRIAGTPAAADDVDAILR